MMFLQKIGHTKRIKKEKNKDCSYLQGAMKGLDLTKEQKRKKLSIVA